MKKVTVMSTALMMQNMKRIRLKADHDDKKDKRKQKRFIVDKKKFNEAQEKCAGQDP